MPSSIKARGGDIHHWGHAPGTAEQVRSAAIEATGLLAVAGGLADDIAALGVPRDKITIHRTGLDRGIFYPHDKAECRAQLGLAQDASVLACVGALIPRKGQSILLDALAQLPGVQLLLAGVGGDEAALRSQAAALNIADRVQFLGAVPHAQLPVVLSAADIFVLPTASEGLANAWVEALACGTPVITTPIPGALELLTNPVWGRIVPREAAPIAEAARELLANLPGRAEVQRGAAEFSWEANAEALVAHWRRLADL